METIKISLGTLIDYSYCIKYLRRLSQEELVNELEYAHATKNSTLEDLVLKEHYRRHKI
jgi:hypothetical protein